MARIIKKKKKRNVIVSAKKLGCACACGCECCDCSGRESLQSSIYDGTEEQTRDSNE